MRDLVAQLGWSTEASYRAAGAKEVAYLSLEFLVGRCLRSNLSALGLLEPLREALKGGGVDLSDVLEREPDPALGNGGLGRLAACLLESLASLSLPATGYGIFYDYGLFRQELRHGSLSGPTSGIGIFPYVHLADLDSHLDARQRSADDFVQPGVWARKALCNVAGVGWFSSDRTILECARDIWDLSAAPPLRGT